MKQRVLITGGTGFVGRQLALEMRDKYELALTGRDAEKNLEAQESTGCRTYLADVTDPVSVDAVFDAFKPSIVIHAAALKLTEQAQKEPLRCMEVNVGGALNVAKAAINSGVKSVLGISSVKAGPHAATPYGVSKFMMEKMFCALSGTSTAFTCIRLGNIAWSYGSVFCTWEKMQEQDGSIGSTGYGMQRFFMESKKAVACTLAILDHIHEAAGKIAVPEMKAVQIAAVLDVWTKAKNNWKKIEARAGEQPIEYLVGETEAFSMLEKEFSRQKFYLISPNGGAGKPGTAISSENSEKMNEEEIRHLIGSRPAAYLKH